SASSSTPNTPAWPKNECGTCHRRLGDVARLFIEHSFHRRLFCLPPGFVLALRFSRRWLPELNRSGLPIYLAVQDGMGDVDISEFDRVFVGGSLTWKLAHS